MCFHCSPFRWHPNFQSVIITQPSMFDFCVFYFRSFVITMNHQHILTASSTMLYHGSWVIWVMGQIFSGSHGSWVTRSDPSPTLLCTYSIHSQSWAIVGYRAHMQRSLASLHVGRVASSEWIACRISRSMPINDNILGRACHIVERSTLLAKNQNEQP